MDFGVLKEQNFQQQQQQLNLSPAPSTSILTSRTSSVIIDDDYIVEEDKENSEGVDILIKQTVQQIQQHPILPKINENEVARQPTSNTSKFSTPNEVSPNTTYSEPSLPDILNTLPSISVTGASNDSLNISSLAKHLSELTVHAAEAQISLVATPKTKSNRSSSNVSTSDEEFAECQSYPNTEYNSMSELATASSKNSLDSLSTTPGRSSSEDYISETTLANTGSLNINIARKFSVTSSSASETTLNPSLYKDSTEGSRLSLEEFTDLTQSEIQLKNSQESLQFDSVRQPNDLNSQWATIVSNLSSNDQENLENSQFDLSSPSKKQISSSTTSTSSAGSEEKLSESLKKFQQLENALEVEELKTLFKNEKSFSKSCEQLSESDEKLSDSLKSFKLLEKAMKIGESKENVITTQVDLEAGGDQKPQVIKANDFVNQNDLKEFQKNANEDHPNNMHESSLTKALNSTNHIDIVETNSSEIAPKSDYYSLNSTMECTDKLQLNTTQDGSHEKDNEMNITQNLNETEMNKAQGLDQNKTFEMDITQDLGRPNAPESNIVENLGFGKTFDLNVSQNLSDDKSPVNVTQNLTQNKNKIDSSSVIMNSTQDFPQEVDLTNITQNFSDKTKTADISQNLQFQNGISPSMNQTEDMSFLNETQDSLQSTKTTTFNVLNKTVDNLNSTQLKTQPINKSIGILNETQTISLMSNEAASRTFTSLPLTNLENQELIDDTSSLGSSSLSSFPKRVDIEPMDVDMDEATARFEKLSDTFKKPEIPPFDMPTCEEQSSFTPFGLPSNNQVSDDFQFKPVGNEKNVDLIFQTCDFEFLSARGSNNTVDSRKDSLLLRFDPLLGKPIPVTTNHSPVQEDIKATQNSKVNDSTFLIDVLSTSASTITENKNTKSLLKVPNKSSISKTVGKVLSVVEEESANSPLIKFDHIESISSKSDRNSKKESAGVIKTKNSHKHGDLVDDRMSVVIQNDVIQNNLKIVNDNETNENNLNSNIHSNEKTDFKMEDIEKQLQHELIKIKDLEKKLKDAEQREEALLKRITEKDKTTAKMGGVIEAYEKAIAELIAEKEQITQNYEKQIDEIRSERDLNKQHLESLESTFTDLHSKYERSKQLLAKLKASEEESLAEKKKTIENLSLQEQRYEKMKNHAMQQLEIANNKLDYLTKNHQMEITKLKALLKKEELAKASLNEQLIQKSKENEELVKICDELISGGSSS